jgi:hypothetical protein
VGAGVNSKCAKGIDGRDAISLRIAVRTPVEKLGAAAVVSVIDGRGRKPVCGGGGVVSARSAHWSRLFLPIVRAGRTFCKESRGGSIYRSSITGRGDV